MIEIINKSGTIDILSSGLIDVQQGNKTEVIGMVYQTDVVKINNNIEVKGLSNIEVKEVNNHIEIYKAGLIGAGGGDSLWEVGAGDIINPKFNKLVNAEKLTGEISGGIFQP